MAEEVSEYGSGCLSGWTMYLGPSHEKPASRLTKASGNREEEGEECEREDGEEDEGFSMVSDASSGPPQFSDDVCRYYNPQHFGEKNACLISSYSPSLTTDAVQNDSGKRRRAEMDHAKPRKVPAGCLDDTASSPFFAVSGNGGFKFSDDSTRSDCSDIEVSSEFSATYLKVTAAKDVAGKAVQRGHIRSSWLR